MLNRDKLKGAIIENGKTMNSFAQYLGITYPTLYRKMNGLSDFTRNEILMAKNYLKLSDEELNTIFFA